MYSQIKPLREQAGLTQRELAHAIEKSRSTVADYERDYVRPTQATLWAIAKKLNVPVDALYTHTKESTYPLDTPEGTDTVKEPTHA